MARMTLKRALEIEGRSVELMLPMFEEYRAEREMRLDDAMHEIEMARARGDQNTVGITAASLVHIESQAQAVVNMLLVSVLSKMIEEFGEETMEEVRDVLVKARTVETNLLDATSRQEMN